MEDLIIRIILLLLFISCIIYVIYRYKLQKREIKEGTFTESIKFYRYAVNDELFPIREHAEAFARRLLMKTSMTVEVYDRKKHESHYVYYLATKGFKYSKHNPQQDYISVSKKYKNIIYQDGE